MKTPTIRDRNARFPDRKPSYWLDYHVEGVRVREPAAGDSKRSAAEHAALVKRQVESGSWVHPKDRKSGKHLFATYAREVIDRRVKRGVKTADKDERGHVENYLVHMFDGMRVTDVARFRVIRDAFAKLTSEKPLAGRYVRNIHSTLRAVILEAEEDDMLASVPSPLTTVRGHLPAPVDADPTWRATAVFDRAEVARLLGCDGVPLYRRVIYATLFMAGGRVAAEVLALRVSAYDRAARPLSALAIVAAKLGRAKGVQLRIVPVHPALRTWLDWWVLDGWQLHHGRTPKGDDLLFPTLSPTRIRAGHADISHNELYKQWQRHDLPAAGLRHRRIHDARRTLVSAARNRAIDAAIVRKLTHRAVADVVLDAYTTAEWETLCREVERVQWDVPGPPDGQVVEMIGRTGTPV